jgi:predicted DNA-binding transcriptional regulator AlpA
MPSSFRLALPQPSETTVDPHASIEPLAVDAAGAATLLGISERHFWAQHSAGKVPRPALRLGRAVRWSVAELRDWLAAGCPERSRWESMRD